MIPLSLQLLVTLVGCAIARGAAGWVEKVKLARNSTN